MRRLFAFLLVIPLTAAFVVPVAAQSPTMTEELLSGMVTEEVEPGLYRVVNDGYRDISFDPEPGWITIAPDRGVWVCREGGLFLLGEPAVSDIECAPVMEVASDGTLWANTIDDILSFDGSTWTDGTLGAPDEYIYLDLATGPDGAIWALRRNDGCDPSASDCRVMTPVRVEADGSPIDVPVGKEIYADGLWIDDLAVGPNGDVWLTILTRDGGWDVATLLRYDGARWEAVAPPDGTLSQNGFWGQALDITPDGTLWIGVGPEPAGNTGLARLDDSGWTVFSSEDGVRPWGTPHRFIFLAFLRVAPDGSVWVNASSESPEEGGCGGVARFDGTAWLDYLSGVCVDDLAIAPDGAVWVVGEADDTAYRGTGSADLYVITPEAVAATE